MDKNVAIKVENVSKKFCKKLKRSMFYGVKDIGKNMAGLKSNSDILRPDEFWAVKDASFEVKKGEALGIIGPNGSGKTTILKMLNGIFWPDKGKISIRGRMGALIAVGAGFHPVLTGRENIYLNGAVLGMGRYEINKKFDAIVDFAGIGDFLDTPVKHYSSGMFVRLGFAIAAHHNPDILLIDEVLAVGDMAFRTKCLDKMRNFINEKKTIVFISHNLHQVEKLCDRVIFLMNGQSVYEGAPDKTIDLYRSKVMGSENKTNGKIGTGEIVATNVDILDRNGNISKTFSTGESATFRIYYDAKHAVVNPIFSLAIDAPSNPGVSHMKTDTDNVYFGPIEGKGYVDLEINTLNLLPNSYILTVAIFKERGIGLFDYKSKVNNFLIKGGNSVNGICYLKHNWILMNEKANNHYNKTIEHDCMLEK